MDFKYLFIESQSQITTMWLNRPEVHNAFHNEMILELIEALKLISKDSTSSVLILKGKGRSFCAGADLNWMKNAIAYSHEKNLQESENLSECLFQLYSFSKPTVAMVHGSVFGGGNGLMSACDFVIADDDTRFSLSEVNLGLIPACIAPYVLKRVGEVNAKSMMLRGNRFDAKKAEKYGLIDVYGEEELRNEELDSLIKDLLSSGPEASMKTKQLIQAIINSWSLDVAKKKTAEWIADVRQSEEGQEGMKAFIEKRKPKWLI
ncbi:MAG: enoyl-CoA hydratase/isomerase family protein [Reichenbachiella sp.]